MRKNNRIEKEVIRTEQEITKNGQFEINFIQCQKTTNSEQRHLPQFMQKMIENLNYCH